MATIKTINGHGNYFNEDAKTNLVHYIFDPQKVISGYMGGCNVDMNDPAEDMRIVSESFSKTKGVQLRHYIISFKPQELNDPAVVNEIAQQFAAYLGHMYQTVYGVHENKEHLHFHLMFNSVSYVTGRKFYGTRTEHHELMNVLKNILRRYGIYTLMYVPSKE